MCSCLVCNRRSPTGPGSLPCLVWRFFFTLVVVGPCLSRGASPSAYGGCVWVAVGGVSTPPFILLVLWASVHGLPGGDPLPVAGGGLWVWPSVLSFCGPLSGHFRLFLPWPLWSSPLPFCFCSDFLPAVLVVSASLWTVVCLFPGEGLCRCVQGVLCSGLLVAASPWWSAFSGSAPSGLSLGVLSVGPVGVAGGVTWLGRVPRLGGVGAWLRGFFAVSPAFLRSPWLAGSALVGLRGLPCWFVPAVSCSYLCT